MLKIAISKEIHTLKNLEYQLINSGIDIDFHDMSKQMMFSRQFPAEIRYLSKNHIFHSILNGTQDLAIVSEHFLVETNKGFEKIYQFENTKTNLNIFIPTNMKYRDVLSFSNKRIATNVPDIARSFFKEKRVRGINIITDDNPQCAVDMGIADCFIELLYNVDSKQYQPVETILETSLVLIISPKISLEQRHVFVDELVNRLESVQNARHQIKMEVLCDMKNKNKIIAEIRKIDENMLVLTTFDQKKVIIQAMIDEKQLWDIKHYLKEIKAEKIIAYNIAKLIL
ncbi:hypothetical protein HW49_01585 [Porphyromonadaceae bacterium COT-184 OH4590]|nr:hypothetical protein HW49_01585 [Porphyromonadaceae bacterium COT-184 OH4590]MDO4725649.1 hypothetical protein [Porphyromonadaceae bacterium]